jgi:glutathione S-transferase
VQALAEKGVSYTGKYTDLFNGQSLSPEYLAVNPKGTVPALIVEGVPEGRKVIADSRWASNCGCGLIGMCIE